MEVMISIARRNLTRREFSVIIVRSRDILLMTIEANKSKIKKMGPDLLMVTTKFEGDYSNHWYLDTSCSNHISGRNEWFIVLNEKVKSKVKFGDNIVVTTEAVDKVMVKRKNGVKAFITNVLYVPKLKNNLLSFRQLAEKGIFYESTLKLNEGV